MEKGKWNILGLASWFEEKQQCNGTNDVIYSQHGLISPPRAFVFAHLFTINAICAL